MQSTTNNIADRAEQTLRHAELATTIARGMLRTASAHAKVAANRAKLALRLDLEANGMGAGPASSMAHLMATQALRVLGA